MHTSTEVLGAALAQSGFNRSAVAARADVAPSTIHRIERGQVDPGFGTCVEILAAAGFQLDATIRPLCDPAAARAARVMLEAGFPVQDGPDVAIWQERLQRWTGGDPVPLMIEAGRAAGILGREGVIGLKGTCQAGRLASAGTASDAPWAVSGAAGLSLPAFGEALPAGSLIRTTTPQRVAHLLTEGGLRITQTHKAATVIVVGSEPDDFAHSFETDGIRYAAPIQIMLDCLGMQRELIDAARAEIGTW